MKPRDGRGRKKNFDASFGAIDTEFGSSKMCESTTTGTVDNVVLHTGGGGSTSGRGGGGVEGSGGGGGVSCGDGGARGMVPSTAKDERWSASMVSKDMCRETAVRWIDVV